MTSINELIESINEKIDHMTADMETVSADKLGLDIRAGHRLHINEDCIIVEKQNDRSLQYYGGFEYIDKSCRQEIGDYVIYLLDDDRVNRCLDRFYGEVEAEKDLD